MIHEGESTPAGSEDTVDFDDPTTERFVVPEDLSESNKRKLASWRMISTMTDESWERLLEMMYKSEADDRRLKPIIDQLLQRNG